MIYRKRLAAQFVYISFNIYSKGAMFVSLQIGEKINQIILWKKKKGVGGPINTIFMKYLVRAKLG